jgi:arginase
MGGVSVLGGPPGDLVLVGVPVDSTGVVSLDDAPRGCELAPTALRAAGLATALGAEDGGDVPVRIVGQARDAATGIIGWSSVAEVTKTVRGHVSELLAHEKIPVLIGGCCAPLPGALAAARDILGPVGLAYVDGHLDLYDGTTSPTGEAADMPIAVVSGLGPAAWCEQVGAPLVPPGRLALLGPADRDEAAALGSALPEELGIDPEVAPPALRSTGPAHAAQAAVAGLGERYWVHLDVDVLDRREFPAVDYPNDNGVTLDELAALLQPLTQSPGMIGFSVACYNPAKDPGNGARVLTELLGRALSPV